MAFIEKKEIDNRNTDVWPSGLILNSEYAMAFACIKCNGVPKSCMCDEDGGILCSHCSKDMADIMPNKAIQSIISKLKVKCISLPNSEDLDAVEGGNVVITQVKDNQCDWTGMIKDIDEHLKECQYIVIQCDKCHKHKSARKNMNKHLMQCPDCTIECPLSCGLFYLYTSSIFSILCTQYMIQ